MEQLPEIPVTHLTAPLFMILIAIEMLAGRKYGVAKYEMRDTGVNILTSIGASFERVAAAVAYGVLLLFFYEYRVFDPEFSWGLVAVCFVLYDLTYYWKHRFEHRIRWAWASHVVHHSSQHLNLSTAYRQTWTFFFTGLIFLQIPLVLLGFHPLIIAFCAATNLIYQTYIHMQMIKKMPRWFEAIMNTPSHHRVHHGTQPQYLDANYAGVFIIWDRIFGTFVPEDESEPVRFGLVQNLATFNVFTVQFHEWRGMFKDAFQPNITLKNRLCYLFKPPGWTHDGSRLTSEMIKERHVAIHPELLGQPGLPSEMVVQTKYRAPAE